MCVSSARPAAKEKRDGRRGAMLVLALLSILVLIPVLGLAIDGANVYLMRNQISTALHAAVLAGIRSVNLGSTIDDQKANAASVAQMTFAADIAGMNPNVSITSYPAFVVTRDAGSGIISVTGSVTASLPLMLMEMIGFSSTDVTIAATSRRRSVNIMLVLDHSGPIAGTPLADMQADAVTFVNLFANGTDNIGLVTYTGAPWLAVPLPNLNFQSNVPASINSMTAPAVSRTNTAAAVSTAYAQLQTLNQPGALNVIVLFTEGLPGAITGNFAGLVSASTPCSQLVSPLIGMLWSKQNEAQIGGLASYTALSQNDTPESRAATGCTQTTTVPNRYLSSMPTTDIYGNSTNGTGTISAYAPVNLASITAAQITAAAENALDDAANQIRSNATIPATIFVVGLGGDPGAFTPDAVLMARVANDPSSAYYNSAQPSGEYIYAPTTAQLQAAFSGIAGQVLKLLQ